MFHATSIKLTTTVLALSLTTAAFAAGAKQTVDDSFIVKQKRMLAKNTEGKGFGPQSPRDIDAAEGSNPITFSMAPKYQEMNLCNIHFHENAEHKGVNFSSYAGNGDGKGYFSGYRYGGMLPKADLKKVAGSICPGEHDDLQPGDTIEVHYVFTTAKVKPGATLGACLNDATKNPQLRVESQVYVLANDKDSGDFKALSQPLKRNGFWQVNHIPEKTGKPIQYLGSTTGPSYNEKGSPLQVTWSVRPLVAKLNINSVGDWCKDNKFDEDHAHPVRNLVTNPALLSPIK